MHRPRARCCIRKPWRCASFPLLVTRVQSGSALTLTNAGPMPLALCWERRRIPRRQISQLRRGRCARRTACAQTLGAVTLARACQASSWPTDPVSIPRFLLSILFQLLQLPGFSRAAKSCANPCVVLSLLVQAWNAAATLPRSLAAQKLAQGQQRQQRDIITATGVDILTVLLFPEFMMNLCP